MEDTKCEELNGEPTSNLNGHSCPGSSKNNQYDFAKFKCLAKSTNGIKPLNARGQILKCYHIKEFANGLQILSQAPHNI